MILNGDDRIRSEIYFSKISIKFKRSFMSINFVIRQLLIDRILILLLCTYQSYNVTNAYYNKQ